MTNTDKISDELLASILNEAANEEWDDVALALRELQSLRALRQPDTRMEGGGAKVRPLDTAPSGEDAMEPSEIDVHEGSWALIIGTNGKPAGWIDTHALFAHQLYCDQILAAPSSPTVGELEVVAWDRLRELIEEYFDLGYAEGVAQRDADTMAGDAQRTLSEIEGIISAAQSNKHGLEQLLEEKRAAINSLRPLFHSTKAQLAEARKVLEQIAGDTKHTTFGKVETWGATAARAFLASLGEKQDAE